MAISWSLKSAEASTMPLVAALRSNVSVELADIDSSKKCTGARGVFAGIRIKFQVILLPRFEPIGSYRKPPRLPVPRCWAGASQESSVLPSDAKVSGATRASSGMHW
jgi:hypothetical protein